MHALEFNIRVRVGGILVIFDFIVLLFNKDYYCLLPENPNDYIVDDSVGTVESIITYAFLRFSIALESI